MIPYNYKLIFEDNFLNPELDTTKWRTRQPWGIIHSSYPYQYYDINSIKINNQGLILEQKYNPTKITHPNGNTYYPDYSVGLVSSKESWRYGWFEIKAQLPKGYGLWPAIWLSGLDTWPPEIDIMEGYTRNKTNYNIFPLYFKKRIQTNIHYSINSINKNIGGKSYCLNIDPIDNTITYICYWEKEFIYLYYNDNLVRKITDPAILNTFNQNMYIILNNAIDQEYNKYIPNSQCSKFIVRSIKIYQK